MEAQAGAVLLLAPGGDGDGGGCSCVNPCTARVRDPAAVGRSSACQKFTIYHLWLTCARVKIIKYAAGSGAHHTHAHTHAHALCWLVLPWPRGTSDRIVQEIKN